MNSILKCTECGLCHTRKNVVVGKGSSNPEVLFIGEAAGPNEDVAGIPFIGRSGYLLDSWIKALNVKEYRKTNVVKCFPNDNGRIRTPSEDEINSCRHWLEQEIELYKPKYIVAIGKIAMQWFFPDKDYITKEAGKSYNWKGIKIFPFIHPSYFLRQDNNRIDWHVMINSLYKELHGENITLKPKAELIYDIETTTFNPEAGRIKRMGFWSYKYNKYIATSDINEAVRIINDHDTIIGYNNHLFDDEWIAYHSGEPIRIKSLDLMKIIKTKQPIMRTKFKDFKLDTVAKTLQFKGKDDIDIKILCAETNTEEEKQKIDKYLKQDVMVTKAIYEWFDKEFEPFKEFLPFGSKNNYGHLTLTTGTYDYKVVCYMAGLEERYDYGLKADSDYEGGFVATPSANVVKGNIYCLDFTSAYPHAFMMQNLYSRTTSEKYFNGKDLYKLKGHYNNEKMGIIENVIKDLFMLRRKYKAEKDPREYAIKIIINTIYGITGDPSKVSVYNKTTAADCTLSVREWIKYGNIIFREEGYKVIYNDTDSFFIEDVYNDEERLLKVRDRIITTIKKNVSFPLDTFGMDIDAKIKGIFFFTDHTGKTKKKNYIYITQENKIKIKGLQIIKSNGSLLSKEILEILKPKSIKKNDIFFSRSYLERLITEKIKANMSIVQTEYKVSEEKNYKSTSCIQVEILKKYGAGTHAMIKNKKIGVGKGVKYCSLEEAKQLTVDDLDLSRVWKELAPFIKPNKTLFEF